MTFAEITQARLGMHRRDVEERIRTELLAPEWQQVFIRRRELSTDGTVYQRCGGGRRIIRKKISGN